METGGLIATVEKRKTILNLDDCLLRLEHVEAYTF